VVNCLAASWLTCECSRKLVQIVDLILDTSVTNENLSNWLLSDKVTSWPGTPADRGWRFLHQSLERYDGSVTGWRYHLAALRIILAYNRSAAPPPWLETTLEVSMYIAVCIRMRLNNVTGTPSGRSYPSLLQLRELGGNARLFPAAPSQGMICTHMIVDRLMYHSTDGHLHSTSYTRVRDVIMVTILAPGPSHRSVA
jgi:hypothetical protein